MQIGDRYIETEWNYSIFNGSRSEFKQFVEDWQESLKTSLDYEMIKVERISKPSKYVICRALEETRNNIKNIMCSLGHKKNKLKNIEVEYEKFFGKCPSSKQSQKIINDEDEKARLKFELKRAKEKKIFELNRFNYMKNALLADLKDCNNAELNRIKNELTKINKLNSTRCFYHLWLRVCQGSSRTRAELGTDLTGNKNDVNCLLAYKLGITSCPPNGTFLKGHNESNSIEWTKQLGIPKVEQILVY